MAEARFRYGGVSAPHSHQHQQQQYWLSPGVPPFAAPALPSLDYRYTPPAAGFPLVAPDAGAAGLPPPPAYPRAPPVGAVVPVVVGRAPTAAPFDFDEALGGIVGLLPLKRDLRALRRAVLLDSKRELRPAADATTGQHHMVFRGNPGTGKTTVGRILARMLYSSGVTKSDRFVEVQRQDLVGEFIGQTAPKTREKVESARGGVLFVDEAYRLSNAGCGNDFGREAIEELMAAMNSAVVIILAGYPAEMDSFVETNPGLFRRVRHHVTFPDYSTAELAAIVAATVAKAGFRLSPCLQPPPPLADGQQPESALSATLEAHTTPQQRSRLNGGIAEFIFQGARAHLDEECDPDAPGRPSTTLLLHHIVTGCSKVPTPPPPPPPPPHHPPHPPLVTPGGFPMLASLWGGGGGFWRPASPLARSTRADARGWRHAGSTHRQTGATTPTPPPPTSARALWLCPSTCPSSSPWPRLSRMG